jgi:predicted nuclease of predicted toxin-antitoxin system
MRLYLDDDSTKGLLVRLLNRAGHDIRLPADIGAIGKSDAVQLTHAVLEDRVLITHNYDDFEELHNLVLAAGGHHPGVIVIRKDNNPKRDLDQKGIVRALGKLIKAGVPIADQFAILNHWR